MIDFKYDKNGELEITILCGAEAMPKWVKFFEDYNIQLQQNEQVGTRTQEESRDAANESKENNES